MSNEEERKNLAEFLNFHLNTNIKPDDFRSTDKVRAIILAAEKAQQLLDTMW